MITRTNAVRPDTDVAVVVAVSLPEPLVALRDRSLIEERARVFILLKKNDEREYNSEIKFPAISVEPKSLCGNNSRRGCESSWANVHVNVEIFKGIGNSNRKQ